MSSLWNAERALRFCFEPDFDVPELVALFSLYFFDDDFDDDDDDGDDDGDDLSSTPSTTLACGCGARGLVLDASLCPL